MFKSLLNQVLAGILGLYLAKNFVPNVEYNGNITRLALIGLIIGLLNFFIKPVLNKISFPLRFITFNLFSVVISMAIIFAVDVFYSELKIFQEFSLNGVLPIFWTTVLVWASSLVIALILKKSLKLNKKKSEKN